VKLAALLALPALLATSGEPKPTRLTWGRINVLMISDSAHGTAIWMSERTPIDSVPARPKHFATFVNPSLATAWIENVRGFLKTDLTDSDTGSLRLSSELPGENGDVLLARRRVDGKWSPEPVLILQNPRDEQPWMVLATERQVDQFLDSLESINSRTTVSESAARDSLELSNPFDTVGAPKPLPQKGATVKGGRGIPAELLGREHVEGEIWASYVVTAKGKADLKTLRIFASDGEEFDRALRRTLERARFKPVTANGVPVPKRVFSDMVYVFWR
jgi:hypothetical protein